VDELTQIQSILDTATPQLSAIYMKKLKNLPASEPKRAPRARGKAGRKRDDVLRILPGLARSDPAVKQLASQVAEQILGVSRNLDAAVELAHMRPRGLYNPDSDMLWRAADPWWIIASSTKSGPPLRSESREKRIEKIKRGGLRAHLARLGATFASLVAQEYVARRGDTLPMPEPAPFQGIALRRRRALPAPRRRVQVVASKEGRAGIAQMRRVKQIRLIAHVLKQVYQLLMANSDRKEDEIIKDALSDIRRFLDENDLLPIDPAIAYANFDFSVFYNPNGQFVPLADYQPRDVVRREAFSRIIDIIVDELLLD
jgi:hypothetical protein